MIEEFALTVACIGIVKDSEPYSRLPHDLSKHYNNRIPYSFSLLHEIAERQNSGRLSQYKCYSSLRKSVPLQRY